VTENGSNSEPSSANAADAADVNFDAGIANNVARLRQMRHDRMVAELLSDYDGEHGARDKLLIERTVAGLGNDAVPPLADVSDAVNADDAADADGDAGVVDNDARQRQLRHDCMVAELLSDYDAEHGASDKIFIKRTVAGLNNDAEHSLANVADVNHYVHPNVWKCVDDGDQQGCGAVIKDTNSVQVHRQSKLHAHGIAIGSPDMSNGICADGWHCVDDGDKLGCGAALSMKTGQWCTIAHKHLASPRHVGRIAEWRRVDA
jgi:hypothetical protein